MGKTRIQLTTAKRIVIKVGTSSLIHDNSRLKLDVIDQLAFTITSLTNQGKEVLLVSSGAIGAGMARLKLMQRPADVIEQQVTAAVGQAELMSIYNKRFSGYGGQIAQVLLTRDVMRYPESRLNIQNTLIALISHSIVPIINENDVVSIEELDYQNSFGDNDALSGLVCQLVDADILIVLSDIDGLFTDNPHQNPQAMLISAIEEFTPDLLQVVSDGQSQFGTGGMASKLSVAKHCMAHGIDMVLANGRDPKVIAQILEGQQVGSFFIGKSVGGQHD
jgi:glutamate 5-kinase